MEIRKTVVEELSKNEGRYNLQEKGIRKKITVLEGSGQVHAFCNIFKSRCEVYYDDGRLIVFGPQYTDNICRMKCLGGIYYNYLQPIAVVNTASNEVIISINKVVPIYDINLSNHNFR